jgi:hypothetical protein
MTNLLSAGCAILVLEASVRILAKKTEHGIMLGAVTVRPTWPELRTHSRGILDGTARWGDRDTSYFIYDRELGWTVGPNRQTRDGLYFSSAEGLRSARPNVRLADQAHRARVALIGDSNAFSFEVPFEESWGHHLQQILGEDVQVLNFGVDGYGIDQIYLRYLRDVRPWNPSVVLVGFIGHDLKRTLAVYPFVSFDWPGYFVKPRFGLVSGQLKLLNVPLPTPAEILNTRQIESLPFVAYDPAYGNGDWLWRFDHGPLFLRYLTSAVPRWPASSPEVSEEAAIALDSRILAGIVTSAEEAGSVPVLVSLSRAYGAMMQATIEHAGVEVFDGTSCVTGIPAGQRKVASGSHYTGVANRAIARCTAPLVEAALARSVKNGRR